MLRLGGSTQIAFVPRERYNGDPGTKTLEGDEGVNALAGRYLYFRN